MRSAVGSTHTVGNTTVVVGKHGKDPAFFLVPPARVEPGPNQWTRPPFTFGQQHRFMKKVESLVASDGLFASVQPVRTSNIGSTDIVAGAVGALQAEWGGIFGRRSPGGTDLAWDSLHTPTPALVKRVLVAGNGGMFNLRLAAPVLAAAVAPAPAPAETGERGANESSSSSSSSSTSSSSHTTTTSSSSVVKVIRREFKSDATLEEAMECASRHGGALAFVPAVSNQPILKLPGNVRSRDEQIRQRNIELAKKGKRKSFSEASYDGTRYTDDATREIFGSVASLVGQETAYSALKANFLTEIRQEGTEAQHKVGVFFWGGGRTHARKPTQHASHFPSPPDTQSDLKIVANNTFDQTLETVQTAMQEHSILIRKGAHSSKVRSRVGVSAGGNYG